MATHKELEQGVQLYLKACNGNQFQACNLIASNAGKLMRLAENSILESEAVNWALTGKKPDVKARIKQHMNLTVPKSRKVNQILGYVEDEDVLDCVEASYAQSVRIGCVTFYYPVKVEQYECLRACAGTTERNSNG